jgi:hypothetical protein
VVDVTSSTKERGRWDIEHVPRPGGLWLRRRL